MENTTKFVSSEMAAGKYEGEILVELMEFDARWIAYAEFDELRAKAQAEGASMRDKVNMMLHMAKTVRPLVKRVELTRKADGAKLTCIDALLRDPRSDKVLMELGLFLLAGTEPEAGKS